MICELSNIASFPQTTDLTLKTVAKISLLQGFVSVLQLYDPRVADFYTGLNNELLQGYEKFFVGYAHGQPVIIGILFISGDSAGIFTLITRENSRGKGYGTDMMFFMMKIAKEDGCDFVTLSASSNEGYRIYERLGFIKAGKFECFEYQGVRND